MSFIFIIDTFFFFFTYHSYICMHEIMLALMFSFFKVYITCVIELLAQFLFL